MHTLIRQPNNAVRRCSNTFIISAISRVQHGGSGHAGRCQYRHWRRRPLRQPESAAVPVDRPKPVRPRISAAARCGRSRSHADAVCARARPVRSFAAKLHALRRRYSVCTVCVRHAGGRCGSCRPAHLWHFWQRLVCWHLWQKRSGRATTQPSAHAGTHAIPAETAHDCVLCRIRSGVCIIGRRRHCYLYAHALTGYLRCIQSLHC